MHGEPFDCVFIRNVLIYFDRDSKRTVVANLIDAMAPGGYLVVGPSEGIYDMHIHLKFTPGTGCAAPTNQIPTNFMPTRQRGRQTSSHADLIRDADTAAD